MSTLDPAWLRTAAWQAILRSSNPPPAYKRVIQQALDRRDDSESGEDWDA